MDNEAIEANIVITHGLGRAGKFSKTSSAIKDTTNRPTYHLATREPDDFHPTTIYNHESSINQVDNDSAFVQAAEITKKVLASKSWQEMTQKFPFYMLIITSDMATEKPPEQPMIMPLFGKKPDGSIEIILLPRVSYHNTDGHRGPDLINQDRSVYE
jgi:hypothetical protein